MTVGRVSRDGILEELVTVLKGITPPYYWTDLGGRVYRRLRPPEECQADEFPLLFVVEDDTDTPIRNDDHGLMATIHAVIIGYVSENVEDRERAGAPAAASRLFDDVCRILLNNLYLNRKISSPILFARAGALVGYDPDYGFLRVEIDLPYHYFKGDLGPLPEGD